jgi:hypothetical protein
MYAATAPRYTMGDAGSLNALIAAGADVTTMALNQPMLIEWNSFSASLATQADIDKLAQPPGLPPGDPSPNSSFIISGYQGNGDGRMMSNPLFVAEDAVDLNGKAIGISKFTLKAGDPAVDKIDPGRWTFSMSEKRGEQIYYFDGGYGGKYLIRVGSEITLPAKQFVIVGGRNMRKGKVIVKKEGLEIEPGTEIFQEEWPKLPGAMPHP